MRTGPDIAYAPSPEPYYGLLAAQARHTAHRAFTDAWWALDPDVVLLRGARITDAEAWSAVVMAALSGGNYLLGDGRQAGELRLAMALAPQILELARDGRAARPEDLAAELDPLLVTSPVLGGRGETAIPHVWRKTSADGTRRWTAVFGPILTWPTSSSRRGRSRSWSPRAQRRWRRGRSPAAASGSRPRVMRYASSVASKAVIRAYLTSIRAAYRRTGQGRTCRR